MKKSFHKLISNDKKMALGPTLALYLRYWWVFLICGVMFAALGWLYTKVRSDSYTVQTTIILNDNDEDGRGSLAGGLGSLISSFNMGGASYKLPEDEVLRIQGHDNLVELVKRLGLWSDSWSKAGMLKKKVFYYHNSPILIDIPMAVLDTIKASTKFDIKVPEGGKNISVRVEQPLGKVVLEKEYPSFPFNVKTPRGTFRVDKSPTYNPALALNFHNVTANPSSVANDLYKELDVTNPSKKSNIIQINLDEVNVQRGRDILDNLVAIYNEKGISTSQEEARQALAFIEDRLVEMYSNLDSSEKKIESYKKANQIIDPEAEATYMFKVKENVETSLVEQQTRVGVIRMVLDFVRSDNNKYSLIPFTTDMPEAPITAYNELVLQRMKLETNAKGDNAALRGVSSQIDAMRGNLITTLERQLEAARIAASDVQRISDKSNARMSGVPTMERQLLSLYRDQKIQNQIYAFLLQKREENQMKLARAIPQGRVVEKAYEDETPNGAGKIVVLAGAVILGFAFAALGLYATNAYTRRRDELANASLPADDNTSAPEND